MELSTHSLSYAKSKSLSPSFIPPKSVVFAHNSVKVLGYNCLLRNVNCGAKQLRNVVAISASDSETSPTDASVRWLLEPIGNGDTKSIGYKIAMPGAFEIASSVVTVGRDSEKADIVLPVPTVSAMHARIQNTEENLLITDLDSTNGTFIDKKRLQPGVVSAASPGNLVTFGDTKLAIFKVCKLEKEEFTTESEKSETKSEEQSEAKSED